MCCSLFTEILNKETNCTEIQFTEDGNWRPMKPDDDECSLSPSPPPAKKFAKDPEEAGDTPVPG